MDGIHWSVGIHPLCKSQLPRVVFGKHCVSIFFGCGQYPYISIYARESEGITMKDIRRAFLEGVVNDASIEDSETVPSGDSSNGEPGPTPSV